MWKLKLQKNILLVLVSLFVFVSPVFAQEDTLVLDELQELANNLSMESYSQEIQQIQYLTNLILQQMNSIPQQNTTEQLLKDLNDYSELMKSDNFVSIKLSEQLKILKNSQKCSMNLIHNFLIDQNMLSMWQSENLKNMNELLNHYNNLQGILLKIIKSQNEDTKLAIEQLTESIQDLNNLKFQLDLCQSLANKQAEEINYLNKQKNGLKRARIATAIVVGSGISLGIIGGILKQEEASKKVGDILFYSGIGLTIGGSIPFVISITIPF